jgi:hypothetical protein
MAAMAPKSRTGNSAFDEALKQCPAIKKRVLIACDVSNTVSSARSCDGVPVFVDIIKLIYKLRAKAQECHLLAYDWKGAWNKSQGLVYSSNPHKDLLPNCITITDGVYPYPGEYNDQSLWHWLNSFGVPAANPSVVFNWAEDAHLLIDAIVFLTDRKSIKGHLPDLAWNQYTNKMGAQLRVANLCLSQERYITDPRGTRHDNVWLSTFFANFTWDTVSELFTYLNGNPQEMI